MAGQSSMQPSTSSSQPARTVSVTLTLSGSLVSGVLYLLALLVGGGGVCSTLAARGCAFSSFPCSSKRANFRGDLAFIALQAAMWLRVAS